MSVYVTAVSEAYAETYIDRDGSHWPPFHGDHDLLIVLGLRLFATLRAFDRHSLQLLLPSFNSRIKPGEHVDDASGPSHLSLRSVSECYGRLENARLNIHRMG